jgi:hypothetical protein
MQMRVLGAAAIIALLAGPVHAQGAVPRYGETDKAKTPGQIEQEKAAERAYKQSLGNVPEKGPVDPWGTTRNAGEPKAAKAEVKTAAPKPKAKTGDAAK